MGDSTGLEIYIRPQALAYLSEKTRLFSQIKICKFLHFRVTSVMTAPEKHQREFTAGNEERTDHSVYATPNKRKYVCRTTTL